MRFALALIIALCHLVPTAATAGAWLRAKGTSFTSTGFSANYFRDIVSTTYMEHGLRDDLTIGLDVGYFTDRFGQKSGFGTLFIRRPFGTGEGANKWSYELGVGTAWEGALIFPHVKTGVSWGRGFQLKEKYGWMGVDASVAWEVNYGLHVTKVDATVGLNFTEKTMGIMQVYLTNLNGDTFGTLAPSVVFKPGKGKLSIQFGAEAPVDNLDNTALKISIWREF